MKKIVYEIDNQGFIIESYVSEVDTDGQPIDSPQDYVTHNTPDGLYRPKWTGEKWVEGATPEEIDEFTKLKPGPPTDQERIANLENTILFLLGGM